LALNSWRKVHRLNGCLAGGRRAASRCLGPPPARSGGLGQRTDGQGLGPPLPLLRAHHQICHNGHHPRPPRRAYPATRPRNQERRLPGVATITAHRPARGKTGSAGPATPRSASPWTATATSTPRPTRPSATGWTRSMWPAGRRSALGDRAAPARLATPERPRNRMSAPDGALATLRPARLGCS
jgi:hypothetical protein